MDISEYSYWCMLFCLIAGVLSAFITKRRVTNYIAHGMAMLGCLAAILCAVSVLGGETLTAALPIGFPFWKMTVRIDGLSAYFLLAVGVVGAAASIYALGYSQEYYEQRYGMLAGMFNLFLLSMVLVFTVNHVAAFIIAWEVMALSSFFLVNHDNEKPANNRAAYVYIVMTHIGTAFIITAFLLLSTAAGSMDFSILGKGALSETTRNAVFLCALIGFGTKAGVIPVHIWLPQAHPAAPSHVSALMSGIMLKTAIYGMCRFFLEFLGTGPVWWGGVVLVLAIISSVLGVLYALMEQDLKRLLAYSSVENIGIILLGLGAGMVFMSKGQALLAALAWVAGLYHVFNHAMFKSLLFMAAGAVLHSTHIKNMERLGGLIKRMPYTAVLFLAGAAAISALPPLNGFVSEWLVFQSLFSLPKALAGTSGKVFGASFVALLGLTGALAGACFVKAFGISFLAKPRSVKAEEAHEVPASMLVAMGILAVACVLLGAWPALMLSLLGKVLAGIPGLDAAGLLNYNWYSVAFVSIPGGSAMATPVVIMLLIFGLSAAILLYNLFGRPKQNMGETWTCGIVPNSRMEYTGVGFSKPILKAFRNILRPKREILVDANDNRYFGRHLSYHEDITYIFTEVIYRPLNRRIIELSHFMKRIQAGSVQLYIGYIMVVTVVALIWSTGW